MRDTDDSDYPPLSELKFSSLRMACLCLSFSELGREPNPPVIAAGMAILAYRCLRTCEGTPSKYEDSGTKAIRRGRAGVYGTAEGFFALTDADCRLAVRHCCLSSGCKGEQERGTSEIERTMSRLLTPWVAATGLVVLCSRTSAFHSSLAGNIDVANGAGRLSRPHRCQVQF